MAIDPKLVSIKEAKDLPVSDPSENANFLFYEGETLQTSPMSNIYDKVSSGIKGNATQSNAPTTYTAETYPNGLTEIWRVFDPLTSPNSWGNIAVTQAELNANDIYFVVTNGVVAKKLSPKTVADPAKLPLYSVIKSANITAGTQFIDDENGNVIYRVKTGQTLLTTDNPANVIGTKVDISTRPVVGLGFTNVVKGDLKRDTANNIYIAKKASTTDLPVTDVTAFNKVRTASRNIINIEGYFGK